MVVLATKQNVPVFNDVLEDVLAYVLSQSFWQVTQNCLLSYSFEVFPKSLVELYYAFSHCLW